MALEAKVNSLEKKLAPAIVDKRNLRKNDSPIFSISYQSDMLKNNNQSLRYDGISESEASKIKSSILAPKTSTNKYPIPNTKKCPIPIPNQILNPVPNQILNPVPNQILNPVPNQILNPVPNPKVYRVKLDDLSDFKEMSSPDKLYGGKTDIINVKVADFMSNRIMSDKSIDDFSEYEKILNGLKTTITSDNIFSNDELDKKILKDISESIQYGDMVSENTLSEISANNSPIKKLNRSKAKN